MSTVFETIKHDVDFCVVGGGLSGMCAAIAAARNGLKVAIMQDRPLFGGNASSEIRMWVCGANGKDNRETGIMEEIALENLYRNPYRTWPVWDAILFEKVKEEKNIEIILNCSCNDIEMDGNRIVSIKGWQTTTQKWHTVTAKYFSDCSGDSVLAPLTGAEYRMGREARSEFDESIAPEVADKKTMGMTCLIQGRQMKEKRTFIAPSWARKFTREELEPKRLPGIERANENFWYMEIGGEANSIDDTETLRDELLRIAMGIWDYIKNSGECDADNWELDFLGFLPGKRESRRYVGDHIMTQHDVSSEGKFRDVIAYGGWAMDDHHPGGINTKEPPTIFHPAPAPFGIPYRCVYSKNIENLFFAGRNISVTHTAMSSTRVMATCAILGQAVGTAAYIADKYGISPRGVYEERLHELQQTLIRDDCYLPFIETEISEFMKNAEITADGVDAPERLINGVERNFEENGIAIEAGKSIVVDFGKIAKCDMVRIVLDSDLNRETTCDGDHMNEKATVANIPLNLPKVHLPGFMAKEITVEFMDDAGNWNDLAKISENRKRLIKIEKEFSAKAVKITFNEAWDGKTVNVFSVDVKKA